MNTFKKTLNPFFILIFILLIALTRSFAQNEIRSFRGSKNAVYGEFIGNGAVYSLNYERLFYKKDFFSANLRFGGEYIPKTWFDDKNPTAIFILGVNELFGSGKHKLEIGMNLVPIIDDDTNNVPVAVSGNVGYRLQPQNNGLLFRIGAVPLLHTNKGLALIGGVSLGYAF